MTFRFKNRQHKYLECKKKSQTLIISKSDLKDTPGRDRPTKASRMAFSRLPRCRRNPAGASGYRSDSIPNGSLKQKRETDWPLALSYVFRYVLIQSNETRNRWNETQGSETKLGRWSHFGFSNYWRSWENGSCKTWVIAPPHIELHKVMNHIMEVFEWRNL